MPLHRLHLDGGKQIINECDVLASEIRDNPSGSTLWYGATTCVSRYPVGNDRFQNNSARRALASPELEQNALGTKRARPVAASPVFACHLLVQSIFGSMIDANAFRALFSRDFTVPRLQSVMSAISSYDFPSSSRRTNTCR